MKYLQDRSHYEDSYDARTVEDARWHEQHWQNVKAKNGKKLPKPMRDMFCRLTLYYVTGQRYADREKSINKWMERDRKRDDLLENTPIPDATCFMCKEEMEYFDKMLDIDFEGDNDSVTFYFRCQECEVGLKVGAKGTERRIPWQCPECKRRMKSKTTQKTDKIVTNDHCPYCDYTNEHVLDLSMPKEEKKPGKKELKRFREDKLRFCLSEEEGRKFLEHKRTMDNLKDVCSRIDARQKGVEEPKIEVLSVKIAQERLANALKKSGCENVSFSAPDLDRDVVVKFKAIDSKERNRSAARKDLKKAIKAAFEGTNWSLMSDGVESRLGAVSGRIKGVECQQHSRLDGVIL
jgi:hypothetical protein